MMAGRRAPSAAASRGLERATARQIVGVSAAHRQRRGATARRSRPGRRVGGRAAAGRDGESPPSRRSRPSRARRVSPERSQAFFDDEQLAASVSATADDFDEAIDEATMQIVFDALARSKTSLVNRTTPTRASPPGEQTAASTPTRSATACGKARGSRPTPSSTSSSSAARSSCSRSRWGSRRDQRKNFMGERFTARMRWRRARSSLWRGPASRQPCGGRRARSLLAGEVRASAVDASAVDT